MLSDYARQVRRYALAGDENLLESLRGESVVEQLDSLLELFFDAEDWTVRDAIITLVQDHRDPRIHQMMRSSLSSTNKETKLMAICALKNDRSLYLDFLSNGYIPMDTINKAINEFLTSPQ